MFAPLVGVPYPRLAWRGCTLLHRQRRAALSQVGGTCPPELVPFNVNHEILRRFQFDPGMDIDGRDRAASRASGPAPTSRPRSSRPGALAEEAILAFPNICTLYSTIGFTWYRLWARPLRAEHRGDPHGRAGAYYEDFMCTTPHNPNNVDLSRDVLFRLDRTRRRPPGRRADGRQRVGAARRGDRHASSRVRPRASDDRSARQRHRRPVVAPARAPLLARDAAQRGRVGRRRLRMAGGDRRRRERAATARGCADVIDARSPTAAGCWRCSTAAVEFMATTELGESPLDPRPQPEGAAGDPRIALMERHTDDEPYIDHDYMERMAGQVMG